MRYGDDVEIAPFSVTGAGEQLARTDALLRAVAAGEAPATLRWYSYDSRAVIMGVGQEAHLVDERACRAAGVAVVKRTSGGGIVFAGPDLLALDVVLPAGHPLAGTDVVEAYRWAGEGFRNALAGLAPAHAHRLVLVDVATARADREATRAALPGSPQSLDALVCFGTLSPYEVGFRKLDHIDKLVGLSQIRKRGVVVFQAGLYTGWHPAAAQEPHLFELLDLPGKATPDAPRRFGRLLKDGRDADLNDLDLSEGIVPRLISDFNAAAAARLSAGAPAIGARR